MSTTVTGTPYKLGQRFVAKVLAASEQYEPANAVDAVYVLAADCIIALPSSPQVDQAITVVATDDPVEVVSNYPIATGGETVAAGTGTEYLFAPSLEWIILATGSSGGGGAAPPEGSFQLAGPGNTFEASTLREPFAGAYVAPDGSIMYAEDDASGNPVVVWEKSNNGAGSSTSPPGSVMNYGTSNSGDGATQADNSYFWGRYTSWLGSGEDPYVGGEGSAAAYQPGAQFTSDAPVLTIGGVALGPNLQHLTGTQPTDEMTGGGSGVAFWQRADTRPTQGTEDEIGLISFVDPEDGRPYGFPFEATQAIPLFAGPTILTFGAGLIAVSGEPVSLYPGFSVEAAQALLVEVPLPPSGLLDIASLAVHQTPRVGADGSLITYQLFADGVAVAGALITIADTAEDGTASPASPIALPANAKIGVFAILDDGTIGASPTDIVFAISLFPHIPA